ncbi:hypothetical protein GCM10011380_01470 [Sphingomonas metalli]|uniref:BLUF domain-containing protein n=1 Tax=Sphingomonas metalli TaxID=1779358 RepID=A0A916STI3_9SPHN|nr:BLUF domain-containing protein [Sphingomonas metalli]GGB15724.1 hypothetical protein GCM10011380_01470 [Sphingomonas metalli]
MHQLLYISTAREQAGAPIDADAILAVSRRNNVRDGVTGLLLYDGRRFLQVLEGEEADVVRVFDRISRDPRHRAIVILSRRTIEAREFGDWSMAFQRRDEDAAATIARVASLSSGASPAVQGTFLGLAEMRRAA